MNRNVVGALVPDRTDVVRRPMPAPQIEPVLESTLTPTDWLHVADALEAKAADLETSDPEIAQIYRRDVTRIRAQWMPN
jgi:hypothetical protein